MGKKRNRRPGGKTFPTHEVQAGISPTAGRRPDGTAVAGADAVLAAKQFTDDEHKM